MAMEKARVMRHAFLLAESSNKFDRLHGLREVVFQAEDSSDEEALASYSAHLDSMDASTGINNFAEEILRAARSSGDEGRAWTSGLSAEAVQRRFPEAFSPAQEEEEEEAVVGAEPSLDGDACAVRVLQELPPRAASPRVKRSAALPKLASCGARETDGACRPLLLRRPSVPPLTPADRRKDEEPPPAAVVAPPAFRTAREKLAADRKQKQDSPGLEYGVSKRSLGTTGRSRGVTSRFVPPVANAEGSSPSSSTATAGVAAASGRGQQGDTTTSGLKAEDEMDERLHGLEPRMIELIRSEIMDHGPSISWDDIAGLDFAKSSIKEMVIFPMLRPDIFTGLRGPPKGLLLFGPPGTGKTLIGKCIASQSRSTFFSISASSLTSKFVGEGEKMVRALFAVARVHQPSVVFIDEIDSLLTQRSEQEHESSRRIKTEFLVQLDGVGTSADERVLVVGATNRPQEIDEAARRRFVKRLYIPLPCGAARRQIVAHLLREQRHRLAGPDLDWVTAATDGYSGADVANLCREAAMGPVRSLPMDCISDIRPEDVRPIVKEDFEEALTQVRASVSSTDLDLYTQWNDRYGSFKRSA